MLWKKCSKKFVYGTQVGTLEQCRWIDRRVFLGFGMLFY
jgi:hypothetical protein